MEELTGKNHKKPLLGELLIQAGVITEQDLRVALEAQRQAPAPLAATLVHLGIAKEEEVLPFLAQQLNCVNVSLYPEKDTEKINSVTDALQRLFEQAVGLDATDIHFEPVMGGAVARFRIDGILREAEIPKVGRDQYPALVSRIKILSNLDIAEKRVPQDGRTSVHIEGRDIDLRISVLPSRYGEAIVVRLLQTEIPLGLPHLGMNPANLEKLMRLLQHRSGLILVTGPTGSGKTTTLYACLDKLNDTTRKIITIEDPIEYTLNGVLQMQVKPSIDLTFGRFLRSVLRHDPNIVMVGEIRDTETAEVAIRTALTGHLVLSTLHTRDSASTVTRLLDMGIEPYLVASSLACAIAQRLVRTICPRCKGKRCVACLGSGLKGRIGIFECLVMDEEIQKLVLAHASADEIRELVRKKGMHSLYEDGLAKVKAGQTTQEELNRVIHSDELSY